MRRGEIWWAELAAPPFGSEPGYRRPVVVISSNAYNDSDIKTVIVAALTSTLKLEAMPGNLRVSRSESGLSSPSVINMTSLLTVDRRRLKEKVKLLPPQVVHELNRGLKVSLAIP